MGMFSFIEKGLGLRTGATKAAREAKESAGQFLGQQQDFQNELMGLYKPAISTGDAALSRIEDYYSGDQQGVYDNILNSPAYSNLVGQGEGAIARHRQMTGGFRSGTTQENLAKNSRNALQGLVNQYLAGNQYLADYGGNSRNAYANAGAGILNQIGNTMGQKSQIGINQAANKANTIGGVVNLAGNVAKSFFGGF